jgi:ferric-dicitrate binding protein FerR (iron transport regulator)
MTSPAELSSLKSEVAELWKRFKKDEPRSGTSEDPARKALVEQIKALDVRQKELMVRRDAMRHELEVLRARSAGRRRVARQVGFLVGIALGVLSALAAAPALADFTVRLLG